MLPEAKRLEVLSRIAEMESFIVMDERDQTRKPIRQLAIRAQAEAPQLAASTDAVMPIVRTALVINWREDAARTRAERFQRTFPQIRTLADLKCALDSCDPLTFCATYLDIKATQPDNPKYGLLKGLTEGLLRYQATHGFTTEIEAIRHWVLNVDTRRIKADPVGAAKGIGPGVVGNIRINLGIDAVKPDRHVDGVVEQFLQVDVKPERYGELAAWLGYGKKYFDEVLFRYGQAQQISPDRCH